MAQIQIWTRDVDNTKTLGGVAPQHTFFIKVNDDGTREILRGGPDNDSMITGNLGVSKQDYNEKSYDWYDSSSTSNSLNYQGTTVKTASQAEIDTLWEAAWNKAQLINSQNYDYEPLTQNCNTITSSMASSLGVTSEVDEFLAQKNVWTPGLNSFFTYSTTDKAFNFYKEVVSQAGSTVVSTVDDINDWVSNFIATREFETSELQTSFEESHSYTVRSNDTLYSIASLYGLTVEDLLTSNQWLTDENRISSDGSYALIKPGETLTIPDEATLDENSDYYNQFGSFTSEDRSELSNITDLLSSSDLVAFTNAIKSTLESELQQSTTIGTVTSSFLTSLTQAEATQPTYRRDPLTLDLDGDGIDLVSLSDSSTFFDLDNDGLREQVGWVKADDGFLVYDSNNNSSVDNVSELFGYENEDGTEYIMTKNRGSFDMEICL